MSLKKIIKEEMDDFEWIRKSQVLPLDIAKDLVNQTEIIPDAFMGEPMIKVPFTNLQFNEPGRFVHLPSLNKYIKTNYGIEDNLTISSIVNMWSAMTKEKMKKTLTESDDLQWIRDVKVNPWDGIEFKVSAEKTLKTTYKILDWGDPKGVRVVWRDNDDYHNKWKHTHYTREEVENYVNKGNWVIVNKNINESDDLDWIKDIKTNNDIAQEIYDGLEWYKEPNVSTNFVRPQWNDYNFSVRTSKENKEKVVIHPHSFHIGFTQYLLDNWGIYDVLEKRKIMKRVKELINQKIR